MMKATATAKTLIDSITGEQYEEVVMIYTAEDIESQQRQTEREREHYKRIRAIETADVSDFSFSFMDQVKLLREEELSGKHLGYVLLLQTYTNFDNVLFTNKQSKKPMNRTNIGTALQLKNRGLVRVFIYSMLEKEILLNVTTSKGKGFKFNEKYAIRGGTRIKHKVKVFHDSIRQLYTENSAEDVSFLYSLLPYISYWDNVLATNPYQYDPNKLDVLTIKDMAEITGLSVASINRKKSGMTFNGMYVFKTEKKGKAKFNYVINPLVFIRNNELVSDSLVRSFKINGKSNRQ